MNKFLRAAASPIESAITYLAARRERKFLRGNEEAQRELNLLLTRERLRFFRWFFAYLAIGTGIGMAVSHDRKTGLTPDKQKLIRVAKKALLERRNTDSFLTFGGLNSAAKKIIQKGLSEENRYLNAGALEEYRGQLACLRDTVSLEQGMPSDGARVVARLAAYFRDWGVPVIIVKKGEGLVREWLAISEAPRFNIAPMGFNANPDPAAAIYHEWMARHNMPYFDPKSHILFTSKICSYLWIPLAQMASKTESDRAELIRAAATIEVHSVEFLKAMHELIGAVKAGKLEIEVSPATMRNWLEKAVKETFPEQVQPVDIETDMFHAARILRATLAPAPGSEEEKKFGTLIAALDELIARPWLLDLR